MPVDERGGFLGKSLQMQLQEQSMIAKVGVLVFLSIMLTGCEIELDADLYVTDIEIVHEQPQAFQAQLAIEVPTCKSEKIADIGPKVLALFDANSNATIAGCNNKGMTSLLGVVFEGELTSGEPTRDLTIVRVQTDENTAVLKPVLNPKFMQRVNALLQENMQSLSFKSTTMTVTLHNDRSDPVSYVVPEGWIDDQPVQGGFGELERRQKVKVRGSNVLSALLLDGSRPTIMRLGTSK